MRMPLFFSPEVFHPLLKKRNSMLFVDFITIVLTRDLMTSENLSLRISRNNYSISKVASSQKHKYEYNLYNYIIRRKLSYVYRPLFHVKLAYDKSNL